MTTSSAATPTDLTSKSDALARQLERESAARRGLFERLVEPYVRTAFHPVPTRLKPWVSYVFVSHGSQRHGRHDFAWLPDAGVHVALFTPQDGRNGTSGNVLGGALRILGPHSRLQPVPATGWESIGVALRPGGARTLMGLPIAAIADAILDAREVWGSWADEVLERVARQRTLRQRVELFLHLLCTRADEAPDRFMDDLIGRVHRPGVDLRLRSLAATAGYSERQLRRKLADQLGIGAKELSRIVRLHAALSDMSWREHGWADHAVRCGYYDQSHLIAEFQSLLGQSPERFIRAIVEPRLLAARLAITQMSPPRSA